MVAGQIGAGGFRWISDSGCDVTGEAEVMNTELAVHEPAQMERAGARPLEALVVRAMNDPSFDVEKLERLMALMERKEEQGRKERFFDALARVQKQVPRVRQNGLMDRGQGKGQIPYASREDIDAVVRPIYLAEGFSVTWDAPASDESGNIHVQGRFTCHGHTELRVWTCKPDASGGKTGPQAVSSTIAYGKRQISKMFWDIIEEGQDKNGADVEVVSQNQADDIRTALTDIGANMDRFYGIFGVKRLEEIKVSQLPEVYARIEQVKKARSSQK